MKFPLNYVQKSLLAASALFVLPAFAAEYEPPDPVTTTKIYFGCNLNDFKASDNSGCTPVEEYTWRTGGTYTTGYQYTHGFFINGSLGDGGVSSEELATLQGQVDGHEQTLSSHTQSINSLEGQVDGLATQVGNNTRGLTDLTGQVSALAEQQNQHGTDIASHTQQIQRLDGQVSQNTREIANNKQAISTNTQAIDLNKQAIATNSQNIASNKQAIDLNKQAIADNKNAIALNKENIESNKQAIAANTQRLDNHQQAIHANTQAINVNKQAIDLNKQAIADNKNAIALNKENIESNKQAIAVNTQRLDKHQQAIHANTQAINVNKQAIALNKQAITDNANAIALNKKNIGLNKQAIATNAQHIEGNKRAIALNKQGIADNKTNIQRIDTTVAKGLNIAANKGVANYQFGDTIKFTGGKNIQTYTEKGELVISLVDNPQFNREVNAKGGLVAHQYLATPQNTLIDFGGNRVQNVGDAQMDSDAVNLRQLKGLHTHMNKELKDVRQQVRQARKTAHAGTAAALAVASMPQAWDPSQMGMSLGTAIYRGETGYALGLSRMSASGRWVLKGALTADSRGGMGATVGAFFAFE